MKILYEDGVLLVCEKPAGIGCEADGSGKDLLSLAQTHCGASCFLVHRLDRETGGAIVLAKTSAAAAKLSEMVRTHAMQKEYLAVVQGAPEAEEGTYEDLLFRDARKNKSYVVKRERKGVRKASLSYRVIKTCTNTQGQAFSLVRIRLYTGRTHQIRVQFSSRGMPLIGDRRYGGNACSDGMALWSCCLAFAHPESGKPMRFESFPPPQLPWTSFA